MNLARGLGSAASSPSGSGQSPAAKRISVHFELKLPGAYSDIGLAHCSFQLCLTGINFLLISVSLILSVSDSSQAQKNSILDLTIDEVGQETLATLTGLPADETAA